MMKHFTVVIGAVVFLGILASPAFANCTEADIHNAVAQWANVPPSQVTDSTQLDGLGGRSWPEHATPLINEIEIICGCLIPPVEYELMDLVGDIDEYAGVEDLPEE